MQNIISDKPYHFVAPHHGGFWPALMRSYVPRYLRRAHGIHGCEFLGLERLKSSLAAGHGIMLAPNHCRPCDPMVLGMMTMQFGQPLYTMASWHVFLQGRFQAWLLPRLGVFSVYREGLDREALKCAVNVLADAKRPLVLFPEGVISRTNDRLNPLMDGTSFIAHLAAKRRSEASPPGKVVIHPVAMRYFYGGDINKTVSEVLSDIEARLTWRPQTSLQPVARLRKVGEALLTLKELEYTDTPRPGTLSERVEALIDELLSPLEEKWLKGRRESGVTARVKALRAAIVPDMVGNELTEDDRAHRWQQLADIYLAQQLALYPPHYLSDPPTPEQMLETVERFEEDLTDTARIHQPIVVKVAIGEAFEVPPNRERSAGPDPVMARIRCEMESLLGQLKDERPSASPYRGGGST